MKHLYKITKWNWYFEDDPTKKRTYFTAEVTDNTGIVYEDNGDTKEQAIQNVKNKLPKSEL
jgi:hypothetical protein